MFNSLSDRLTATFKNLKGKGRLTEADVDATVREIRRALLDADVAVPVVREFTAAVKERALGLEVSEALNPGQQVVKIVNEELQNILGGQTRRIRMAKTGPTIIMLAGLQGAGKTTLAGKLGKWLKGQGHRPLLVASDLQRPNAVTQLKVVGERAGVPVFAPHPGTTSEFDDPTGDPVQVARDGVAQARARLHDVVIVDTAGRLGIDEALMDEARDIPTPSSPTRSLLVVDAMIGQDAVNTAQAFNEGVDFTGVVLSKLDGDARGGAALSVNLRDRQAHHVRLHRGERRQLRAVPPGPHGVPHPRHGRRPHADRAGREAVGPRRGREDGPEVHRPGGLHLRGLPAQMQQLRKMGSMKKMLMMMPGAAGMREQLENFDEREIDRVEAIVRSMTPHERVAPKIINGSRRARIAKGSGVTVSEVNQLMERFAQAQKMMKRLAQGKGVPGMPAGIPGMPGAGGGPKKGKGKGSAKKGGSRSGNPAKRAQENAALEQQRKQKAPAGSAFGAAPGQPDPADLNLPKGFEKFLGQ